VTVTIDDRGDVNLDTLDRVALQGESVCFSGRALERMAEAHELFQRYVEANQGTFIYGVTSGYGPAGKGHLSLEASRERRHRATPWLGLSFGGGLLPEYVSRGAVFSTMPMMVAGNTATHPERARAWAARLDGPLPQLPRRGLVAAGELMPNFVLGAYADADLLPGEGFSAGSGNGAQTSNAMAGLAAIFARRRLALAERLFALSVEAFNAPLDAYHPALKGLWGDRFEAQALDRLGELLDGATAVRRGYQAPVSYRILPRVLGQARRAVATLEEVAAISLREVASNPLFILPGAGEPQGRALSSGGFHNATAAPAIDAVAAAWTDLAALAQRHIVKLHQGDVSLLPDRLLPAGTDYTTGYSTTYLEYVPNQALDEMRRRAQPTLVSAGQIAASEQDDVAITAPIAFVAEREVAQRFDELLAVLGAVCSQALHVTARSPAPGLEPVLDFIRAKFPPVAERRPLGSDCERLSQAISRAIEHNQAGPERTRAATGPGCDKES